MLDLVTADQVRHIITQYGYVAIFLLIAIESTGIPVPGETALLVASVYAGTTHHLSLWMIVLVASAGAIAGDNIGYVLGRYGGYRLLHRYGHYVRLDERRLRLGQHLFDQHGGKVVFFGRFVPILRIWAAFLAGAHRMPWQRFLAFNASGGIVWATIMGCLGYILGNKLLQMGGIISVVSAILALMVAGTIAVAMRRSEKRLQHQMDQPAPAA